MASLTAADLLNAWELGLEQPDIWQPLALLHAALPEFSSEALARLSVGRRDAYLLTLREWIFGPRLTGIARCPACDQDLELAFDSADIRATPQAEPLETLSLTIDGYELQVRLPNSLDAAAVAGSADLTGARRLLLDRCLTATKVQGEAVSPDELPSAVLELVVARMSEADPQADVQLALCCPDCGHAWQTIFDIGSFLWSEVNAWAQRILHEVHILASAYGWREAEILGLSPWRRQSYLEAVGQ
ncbi:MAG: phage baseplate protein [Dehalococcoidia bacterium]